MFVVSCPITIHLCEEAGSIFLLPCDQTVTDSSKVSPLPSLLRAEGTPLSQPLLAPRCSSAVPSLGATVPSAPVNDTCSFGIKLVFADAFPQKGEDTGPLCVTDRVLLVAVLQPSAAQRQKAQEWFSLLLPQCPAWLMYKALQGGQCMDPRPGPLSQLAEFPVSVCGGRDVVTPLSGVLVHVTILGVHYVSWQYVSEQLSDLLLTFLCVMLCRIRSVTTWNCSNFFFLKVGMRQLRKSPFPQRCNAAFGSKKYNSS